MKPAVPVGPLAARACAYLDKARPMRRDESQDPNLATTAELAEAVGVHQRTWKRWTASGWVPMSNADRAAVALGTHPGELWPEWSSCDTVGA